MTDTSTLEMSQPGLESVNLDQAKIEMRQQLLSRIDTGSERSNEHIYVHKKDIDFAARFTIRPNAVIIEDVLSQDMVKPHIDLRVSSYGLSEAVMAVPLPKGYAPESKVLVPTIVTRDSSGAHHPYLYAREVFDHSWNHFVRSGNKPDVFFGVWSEAKSLDTNYLQFNQAVEKHRVQLPEESTQAIWQLAAFETWNGQLARDHGFNTVSVVRSQDFGLKNIKVLFY